MVACFNFRFIFFRKCLSKSQFFPAFFRRQAISRENGKNLLWKKLKAKKCKNLEFALFSITNLLISLLLSFRSITFSRCICFQLFQRFWNQCKILRFLNTQMQKANKNFLGSMSTKRVSFRISKNANSQEMA